MQQNSEESAFPTRREYSGTTPLRSVVIGAGFAGEGHTRALQSVGVEVVALCARQPEIVRMVAERLGIPVASTDWEATVTQLKPDIVAIATPASLRREVIEVAAKQSCHLYCDKPLAINAPEAEAFYRMAEAAGIKHAYAATRRYDPSVAWLAELVQEGTVGPLKEIVFTLSTYLAPILPWYRSLVLAQGGGLLNNHFVHLLSSIERIVSGPLVRVTGYANFDIDRAPVIPGIHDFRDWAAKADIVPPEDAEWRECDADTSYSALMRFAAPTGEVRVTLISGPGAVSSGEASGMCLRGERGTLFARGEGSYRVSSLRNGETSETDLPIPDRLTDALPKVGSGTEDRWAALARDFVADIRGEAYDPYLTFRDGWRYQEAIDAIRSGKGWHTLPTASV